MWKHFISEYLTFTKKERTGTIVLLALILFFILLPFFYSLFIKPKVKDATNFKNEIAALKIKQIDTTTHFTQSSFNQQYEQTTEKNNSKILSDSLFYFDPNTATGEDWKKLGLRDKAINTIQHYTSKGGRFYKPQDIGKIWGIHPDEVKRLLPYVNIKLKDEHDSKKTVASTTFEKSKSIHTIIEINTADTLMLIALPGIGSKLAQRVINFRDKLGGFYSIQQIAETFGLPDSTFQKIKERFIVNIALVKQIDINAATLEEMKLHPYIRYALANAILQYRQQHGKFTSVASIKNIMLVTDDLFNKLAPYLIVE